MPLPGSGEIDFDEINVELGNSSGSEANSRTMAAAAVPTKSTPDSIEEWYSYDHFGRCYGQNDNFIQDAWIERAVQGSRYSVPAPQSEALEFYADRNENTSLVKTSTGTTFSSGDSINVTLYRRTKNTTNSWSVVNIWTPYTSQTYATDFTTYDYKWVVEGGV